MKHYYIFFINLFFFSQASFGQLSKFEESYIKTFDPQGYSYYKFGEGIANQGKQIAAGLSKRLDNYQGLIDTQDPNELLADFEAKMQNIESLEANFIRNSNQFAYNTGEQIGNSINNNDVMGALSGLVGFASSMSAQKEAKRKLAAQKATLKQQRINKMSQVYYKAKEFNETKQKEYLNRAAFAKDLKQEKYNLAFVENLKCFSKSMKSSWSSTSTYWLKNRCPKPQEPTITTIENKFIAKDIQVRKIAERKYKFYKETGYEEFKDAAISYAASAANTKGTAANYFLLGKYYASENPILGLSTLLTAKSINPNFKKNKVSELIEETKNAAESEINQALVKNDVAYINSFLDAGLDRLVKIDGKSILTEAISLDNPDAVQTILNKYIDGLPQQKINEKIHKTILLCALKDSYKTIKRFSELGVSTDFKVGRYHPIDLAVKGQASKAYKTLLELSDEADVYKEKYKNSTIHILGNIKESPSKAAADIDKIENTATLQKIVNYLFERIDEDRSFLEVLLKSEKAKKYLSNTLNIRSEIKDRFTKDIVVSSPTSLSASFLKSGLISFSEMPLYGDFVKATAQRTEKATLDGESFGDSALLSLSYEVYQNSINNLRELQAKYNTDYSTSISPMEKEIREVKKLQASGEQLTKEVKKKYLSMVFSSLANDTKNLYTEYKKPFKSYFEQHYEIKESISLEEKIDVIISGIEKYIATLEDDKQKSAMTSGLNIWKGYKKRANSLLPVEQNVVESSFAPQAINQGLPLDRLSVNKLTSTSNNGFSLTKAITYKDLESKSLALVAYISDNYELFSELDKEFDLGNLMEHNGKSLLENMIRDGKKFGSNPAYLSEDFNIKDKDLLSKIAQQLIEGTSYPSATTLIPLKTIIIRYNLKNNKITNTGGTLLHWYVDSMLKEANDEEVSVKSRYIKDLVKGLNIDKTIEDENGLTAYKLYDKNLSTIKKYWKKENREALGGRGLIKGMANKMMRKGKEEEVEKILKPE